MKTEYEKQADEVLAAMGVTFEAKFLFHGRHFAGEKETRYVYEIIFTRPNKDPFTVKFEQSVVDSSFFYTRGKKEIKLNRDLLSKTKKEVVNYIRSRDRYFLNNGKSDVVHYPTAPSAYDVLACFTKYDPGDFEENFYPEFGYDPDSRKAEEIYRAVVSEWRAVRKFFSIDEIEQLKEIQ